jgi:hypothetical protein
MREDLAKVIDDVNQAITMSMPALYKSLGAQPMPMQPLRALTATAAGVRQ